MVHGRACSTIRSGGGSVPTIGRAAGRFGPIDEDQSTVDRIRTEGTSHPELAHARACRRQQPRSRSFRAWARSRCRFRRATPARVRLMAADGDVLLVGLSPLWEPSPTGRSHGLPLTGAQPTHAVPRGHLVAHGDSRARHGLGAAQRYSRRRPDRLVDGSGLLCGYRGLRGRFGGRAGGGACRLRRRVHGHQVGWGGLPHLPRGDGARALPKAGRRRRRPSRCPRWPSPRRYSDGSRRSARGS